MNSTKRKILETAEFLFAEQGIASTSLRNITQTAQVNIAAVNYHFGNKQKLIHELFRRRLDQLNQDRLNRLNRLLEGPQAVSLEGLLQALIFPAMDLRDAVNGGQRFIKVLARAYAENDSDLHAFLSDHYGHVLRRFAQEIRQLLPESAETDLRWQLDFVIGALTYVMADFGGRFSANATIDSTEAGNRLVAFAAAGMRFGGWESPLEEERGESLYENMKYANQSR